MNSLLSSLLKTGSKVANLDSDSFAEQMQNDEDSVLIDVRTLPEHNEVRIPNSKLMNLMDPNFTNELEKLDKSKSYYLYCRSGNRSYHVARQMANMGFEKVYNLAPGIIGWYGPTESVNQ